MDITTKVIFVFQRIVIFTAEFRIRIEGIRIYIIFGVYLFCLTGRRALDPRRRSALVITAAVGTRPGMLLAAVVVGLIHHRVGRRCVSMYGGRTLLLPLYTIIILYASAVRSGGAPTAETP